MIRNINAWAIYYHDWSVYTSDHGSWAYAPEDGVIGVMIYFDEIQPGADYPVRRYMSGQDWYFSDGENLFAHNNDSYEMNQKRYPMCVFIRGQWTDDATYHSINEWAYMFKYGPPTQKEIDEVDIEAIKRQTPIPRTGEVL